MKTLLIAVGLAFDIFGAGLIIVPDVPRLDRHLFFGRLQTARQQMESSGISAKDTGFTELAAILNELDPAADFNEDGDEITEIIVNRRGGFTSERIQQSGINWGSEYIEAWYGEDDDLDTTAFFESGEVYRRLRQGIEPQVMMFRVAGFLTLALGFIFQLLGTVLFQTPS